MSSNFESILGELHGLEAALKTTATRLWEIKFSLLTAGQDEENEFLVRRLTILKENKETEFQTLLDRLHQLISLRLDRALFIFDSTDDVANLARINRTLRSLNNAFARELELGQTWARLNSVLPATAGKS
ncbi:MAG: hypothetical protein Q7T11_07930 [Deltaproteobacteria bacterium]|nr:hypothetical protein [Deltaproteobacteria bacterium]